MLSNQSSDERRLDIQGLRGVAIVLVVAYHAGLPVPGGFLGVDVFFVISGYVIMAGLTRRLTQRSTFSLLGFFGRRVRRLLPALALLLIFVCLASLFLQSPLGPQQSTARMALHTTFWIANVEAYRLPGGYFDPAAETYPLLHTWSLSVEEQFYLLFPVLVLLAWKLRQSLKAVQVTLIVGTTLSFAVAHLMTAGVVTGGLSAPERLAFYAAPTRAWEFGVGAILATVSITRQSNANHLPQARQIVAITGALLLLASAFALDSGTPHPGAATLLPVGGTAILIWAGAAGSSWPCLRPLVWLGDRSYSWYLWHWPFVSFVAVLLPTATAGGSVAAAVSLIPAWLSYKYVENRYRSGGRRSSVRPARIVVNAIAANTALALLLTFGALNHWWSPTIDQMVAQTNPLPLSYTAGCHAGAPPTTLVGTDCEWNPTGTAGHVFLVGDSNAAMYSDGLVDAVEQTGHQLIVSTLSSCPLVEAAVRAPQFDTATCTQYVAQTLSDLEGAEAATIVTAAAGNQITDPQIALAGPDGQFTYDAVAKAAIWKHGFEQALSRLTAAGHNVVVVQVIPHFLTGPNDHWRPENCPMISAMSGPTSCAPKLSRAASDVTQQPIIHALAGASRSSGAHLIDLRNALCPLGICSAYQSGEWIYRDGTHISPKGSAHLTPLLREMLRSR